MLPKVESPFVGLVPYTEDDAEFFFGRERDQQRILANLFASRLTILYGASGVGKSSVLRAGIVQEVRQRIAEATAAGEPPEIAVVYFNDWKGDVLLRLRAAIGNALVNLLGQDYISDLPDSISLEDLLAAAGARIGGDLLLILDQFEEYFLYHPGTAPDQFTMQFAQAANHTGIPANFLISLRDDAVSRLDRFKPLIPNLFSNYLRLHHLSGDDARDTILKPVEAYNLLPEGRKSAPGTFTVEPDLVAMVLDQAHTGRVRIGHGGQGQVAAAPSTGAVETPYLQLVMTRLWSEERSRASYTLRCDTLRELGGAETIVKGHLETALAGLSEAERAYCAMLFPHLVTPSGTKIAHTVMNLARFAKVPTESVRPLLQTLAASDKRILAPVAPPDGQPGELQYEIYHDSLAQAVLSWQARYEAAREATARTREKHRIVAIAAALAVAFLIAVGAAGVAFWQYRAASTEREHAKTAEAQARKAEAEAYALKSESDALRLEKERTDAEKNHNAALVAALTEQVQSARADATKFNKQAAAAPVGDSKNPALADIVRERDALRNQVASLETRPGYQRQVRSSVAEQSQPRIQAAAPSPRATKEESKKAPEKAGPNTTEALHIGTKADVLPANMVREQFGKQIGENCVVVRVRISNPAARPLSLDPPVVSAEGKPYALKTVSDRSKVKKGVLWLPTSTVPAHGEVEAHVFFDKKRFASPDQPSYSFRVEGTLLQP